MSERFGLGAARHVIVWFAVSLPFFAWAQSEAELKRYAELDRKCEAAREKKLAPVRGEKIETCIKDQGRSRRDCEAEYATFGNTRAKVGGGAIGGIFYDLPECVAATEARSKYRQ